jgi:hypothetical protein
MPVVFDSFRWETVNHGRPAKYFSACAW